MEFIHPFFKEFEMSAPSKANVGNPDNRERPKTNHQAGTEPSV
jgi:hypothetical protein